jgi:LacI family transcriptional regulator
MTVTEIAKRAGVSIGTVDRVLHDRGRVAPATRDKIRMIIEETGFHPNPLARHLQRNTEYRIGFLVPELELESRYWDMIYRGFLSAAEELSAFSFKIEPFTFVRPDRASLADAFDRMVASNCCAWIIAPVMQDETLVLLAETGDSVPYVFIDSSLPGAHPLSTVAQDPFKGGYLAGRLMDLLCVCPEAAAPITGPREYAVISPYTEAFNLNERTRGFRSWFEGREGVRIIEAVVPEENAGTMHTALDALLGANPGIRGIFVVSAAGHKVAAYFKNRSSRERSALMRNDSNRISLIGYDLVSENVECLRDGLIDCLISQRPQEQARFVMQRLYRMLVLGDRSADSIDIPCDIFLKENIG